MDPDAPVASTSRATDADRAIPPDILPYDDEVPAGDMPAEPTTSSQQMDVDDEDSSHPHKKSRHQDDDDEDSEVSFGHSTPINID